MGPRHGPTDRAELWIGLGFAALACLALALIPGAVGPYGAEATILPLIGAGALAIFSLVQISSALLGRAARADEPPPKLSATGWLRYGAAAAIIALHAWLLPLIGIVVAGISMQILLYLLIAIRPVPAIVIALAVTTALYLGIHTVLGVPLPAGQLW